MTKSSKTEYSIPFSVRLPERYIKYIAKKCAESGIRRSEYIRKLVLNDYRARKK